MRQIRIFMIMASAAMVATACGTTPQAQAPSPRETTTFMTNPPRPTADSSADQGLILSSELDGGGVVPVSETSDPSCAIGNAETLNLDCVTPVSLSPEVGEISSSGSGSIGGTTTENQTPERRATSISGAEVFTDPDGHYQIEINPDWHTGGDDEQSDFALWYASVDDSGYLAVSTETRYGSSLEDLLYDASDLGPDDIEIARYVTTGSNGQEIGIFEFISGDQHFLMSIIRQTRYYTMAVVFSDTDEFELMRPQYEAYLMTLDVPAGQ